MILPGKGAILQHGVSAGSPATITYTTIGTRTSITPAAQVNSEKDRTTLDSVVRTMAAALLDPGEITCTVFMDPTDTIHALLYSLVVSGVSEPWRLIFNDAAVLANRTHIDYTGFVKSVTPGALETETDYSADIVIRVDSVQVIVNRS